MCIQEHCENYKASQLEDYNDYQIKLKLLNYLSDSELLKRSIDERVRINLKKI